MAEMFRGIRGVVIVFVVVGVIAYLLSGSGPSNTPSHAGSAQTSAAPTTTPAATPAQQTHKEGEPILVGYTGYGVWRSWWSSRLTADSLLNKPPNAKYLFVVISVANQDNKARDIPPFQLVDDQGAEYDADARGMMLSGAIGPLESLNPSVSKMGFVVFDVPTDKHYRLKLSGGYWSGDSTFVTLDPAPKMPKNPLEKLEHFMAQHDKAKSFSEDRHD